MKGTATPNSSSRDLGLPDMNLQPLYTHARKRPSTTGPGEGNKKIKLEHDSGSDGNNLPNVQLYSRNVGGHRSVAKDAPKFLSADEIPPASREQYADDIQALRMQKNFQALDEARQQLEKMLSGMVNAFIITLEILSDLDPTQIALLSSTTVLTRHGPSALANWPKSNDWKDEEKAAFCHQFTYFVPGTWHEDDILDIWEDLFKVLIDGIYMWLSKACRTNVLESSRDSLDTYRKALKVLAHQNKHRSFEARKMAMEGKPEIVMLWELALKIVFNVMLRQ